ncbi:MAG: transglycosylase SLT domain-containing protein [bacterium]|nr:transglycosylase SLT domain-containing protein [bacterium]
MATTINNLAAAPLPKSDLERLRGKSGGNLEADKARLKKATKEFESLVVYEMLKTMRKTIPESDFTKGSPFSGGMGKDIFEQMFDMQLSRQVSGDGRQSIASMLYKQVEKILEAQHRTEPEGPEFRPLQSPEKELSPLAPRNFIERPQRSIELSPDNDRTAVKAPVPKRTDLDPVWKRYQGEIDRAAQESGLDSALIVSVIKAESSGDPKAVSSAGASGLMQLIDSTASEYGVSDRLDPAQNVSGGARYLKDMLDRYGSLKLALAAYNAGPGNVDRYGGVPPFEETNRYIDKVLGYLDELSDATASSQPKEVWEKSDN